MSIVFGAQTSAAEQNFIMVYLVGVSNNGRGTRKKFAHTFLNPPFLNPRSAPAMGRYMFRRLPFGISSAQDVFQSVMSEMFEDIDGVEVAVDDVIVWGTNEEEHDARLVVWGTNEEEHDARLVVWGTNEEEHDARLVVWGTNEEEHDARLVVWGTNEGEHDARLVVWGTNEEEHDARLVVWGTNEDARLVVWGTNEEEHDERLVVWGTNEEDTMRGCQ